MFESDQQLYELIFCAYTAKEEEQWRNGIQENTTMGKVYKISCLSITSFEHSILHLDIKTLGLVLGQPGTLMRRQSIQRAATLNSRKNGCQVIIKNTNAAKDRGETPLAAPDSVGRSQSLLLTNEVPILAPKRADRQRMEQSMANVWTREQLPYPGMLGRRKGSLITSATSVMRKLSRASTTTTSTTNSVVRSVSCSSISEHNPHPAHNADSRIPQTDGACSPTPEDRHTSESEGNCPKHRQYSAKKPQRMTTQGVKGQNQRAAAQKIRTKNVAKLRKDSDSTKGQQSREVSGASTILAGEVSIEMEQAKGKLRKPKTLFKAFSTQGIRGWFH